METCIITLKTGEKVIVDADDMPKLSGRRWHLTCKGYAAASTVSWRICKAKFSK